MTGSEYIADFFVKIGVTKVFTVTGGACAFIIDAIAKNNKIDYVCFQHEQSAAMAADASWRVARVPGVTLATSGPGATNLITGIACSYFDSIPTIHITGQVNKAESASFLGANVRQAGFQETNIVDMVKPITKYAVQVSSGDELVQELNKAYKISISGRMGPVLIDVPMNVQKEIIQNSVLLTKDSKASKASESDTDKFLDIKSFINSEFKKALRPLVLIGAGVGLSDTQDEILEWLNINKIPFVSSWGGSQYINHDLENYYGNIGVYGNRGANFIVQNCDCLLVLGSRLDSRQRSGNVDSFAPNANIIVVDIDHEELKKYNSDKYKIFKLDLKLFTQIIYKLDIPPINTNYKSYILKMKKKYFGKNESTFSKKNNTLSPYDVVKKVNELIDDNAIVIPECGANLCWVYQIFSRINHTIFTSYGNSPMGYTVPATIGAALLSKGKQVIGLVGDGGFQMNIQELQTMMHYKLDITIIILNNYGYGIIKQFQDSYFEGRYEATGRGYSQPDFNKISNAYGIKYYLIENIKELNKSIFSKKGIKIVDVSLDPNTLIEPKLEMGNPINNQFPYLSEEDLLEGNQYS